MQLNGSTSPNLPQMIIIYVSNAIIMQIYQNVAPQLSSKNVLIASFCPETITNKYMNAN